MQKLLFFILFLTFAIACNTTKECTEKIDPACVCIEIYQPVCGCNGKTYGNDCMARCAGITEFTQGECPDKNLPALNGTSWILKTFAVSPNPKTVPEGVKITVLFDKDRISGKGGCNNYGGTYATGNNSSLTVSGVVSTKMFCDSAMQWETMYFNMLEKSRIYRIKGNTLEVDCGDMGTLVFEKG